MIAPDYAADISLPILDHGETQLKRRSAPRQCVEFNNIFDTCNKRWKGEYKRSQIVDHPTSKHQQKQHLKHKKKIS